MEKKSNMKQLLLIVPYLKKNIKTLIVNLLLVIMLSLLSMIPAKIIQIIFDKGFGNYNYKFILYGSLILCGIYFLKSILSYLTQTLFTTLGSTVVSDYRFDLYKKRFLTRLE
jgi:ABC-type multidrug transport system fused ATPase/permease subunit